MPVFHFDVPESDQPIAKTFADLPPGVRTTLTQGYAVLARVQKEQYRDLLNYIVDVMASGGPAPRDAEEIAAKLGMTPEQARRVTSAAGIAVAAMLGRADADVAEQFVRAVEQTGLVHEAEVPPLLAFTKFAFQERSALQRTFDRVQLGSEILPSVTGFRTAVDVRVRFDEHDKIVLSVPIAVIHLHTDTEQELVFQMTQWEVEKMINVLQTALRRLKAAGTGSDRA